MGRNKYLTDEMIEMLNKAYFHEITNSVVYDIIGSHLNVLGLTNLAEFWYDWSQEEKGHATLVREFLEQLNISLKFAQLESIECNLDKSLVEFVYTTVEREYKTTNLYHQLLDEAMNFENSSLLISFLHKMIDEQREETDKANTIFDKIVNIGEDRALLQLFDNSFKK